jgi:hypothetical protein
MFTLGCMSIRMLRYSGVIRQNVSPQVPQLDRGG